MLYRRCASKLSNHDINKKPLFEIGESGNGTAIKSRILFYMSLKVIQVGEIERERKRANGKSLCEMDKRTVQTKETTLTVEGACELFSKQQEQVTFVTTSKLFGFVAFMLEFHHRYTQAERTIQHRLF